MVGGWEEWGFYAFPETSTWPRSDSQVGPDPNQKGWNPVSRIRQTEFGLEIELAPYSL
jgi:hypothetical protein